MAEENIFSSQEHIFADDFVYCINYHFSVNSGRVGPCNKPKTRKTLLTPNLEKLLIKLLFNRRKTSIKKFHDLFKNTPLTMDVLGKDIEDIAKQVVFEISEYVKNCRQNMFELLIIFKFFSICTEITSSAVLCHRGGNAPGSLNRATSIIYLTIKKLQELKYFNAETWDKLAIWGPVFNKYCPNSALGLEEVSSDENNSTYFKFIEPRTQSNLSTSPTKVISDVNINPFSDESTTLEEMIRKATNVEKNYFLNFKN